MNLTRWACAGLSALLLSQAIHARPVVFARSTTVMAEYREGAMADAQLSYAPKHWLSWGLGYMELDDGGTDARHSVTYARMNLLLRRWNMAGAQANVFGWAGAGRSYIGETFIAPAVPGGPPSEHDHGPPPAIDPLRVPSAEDFAWNTGAQIDYETRRIYTSFKTDFHYSSLFWHRADTLQFGIAPYKHDMDTVATWLVISGRRYSGDMHEGEDLALLLRFFKRAFWVEAGATTEGRLQAMAMLTF